MGNRMSQNYELKTYTKVIDDYDGYAKPTTVNVNGVHYYLLRELVKHNPKFWAAYDS